MRITKKRSNGKKNQKITDSGKQKKNNKKSQNNSKCLCVETYV